LLIDFEVVLGSAASAKCRIEGGAAEGGWLAKLTASHSMIVWA
jgi:hypothetical protein